MSKRKFEKIHFNDNFKMLHAMTRMVTDYSKIDLANLNDTFIRVSPEEYLCEDEYICPIKARNNLKRYNPKNS